MATISAKPVIVMYFISSLVGSLASKYQFLTYADGRPDKNGHTLRKFSHPWFQEMLMFVGEMSCLLLYIIFYRKTDQQSAQLQENEPLILLDASSTTETILEASIDENNKLIHWILIVPTLCDLTGSCLSGFISMWIDLSVQIMLGGSVLVFTAILSRIFLNRKLNFNQVSGIVLCAVGFVTVSASEFGSVISSQSANPSSDETSWNLKVLAIVFLVISNVLRAIQSIIEEKILKSRNIHPVHCVGLEGTFGTIMTAILLVVWYFVPGPVQPDGRMEDIVDAFFQLLNSKMVIITSVVFTLCIPVLNVSVQSITKSYSALEASLIGNFRTMTTWTFQLFVYYILNFKNYGESLDGYSLIRLDGFIIMILGMLLYNMKEDIRLILSSVFPSFAPSNLIGPDQSTTDTLNA